MDIITNSSLKTKTLVILLSIVLFATLPLVIYYRTTFAGLLSLGIGSDNSIDSAISIALEKSENETDKETALTAYRSYHQAAAIKATILKEIRFFTVIYFCVVIIISALIGWLLVTRLTKPLKELAQKMTNTGRDNSDTAIIQHNPHDEIASLSIIFKAMTRRLNEARKKELLAENRHAWEQVARVLAHEIKNPLTPIKLSTERLYDRYINQAPNLGEVMESTTKTVLAEIKNLERLVDSFRQYARLPDPSPEEGDLRETVNEVVSLYGENNIDFSITGFERPLIVTIDKGQIRQVFGNIIKNGIESAKGANREIIKISINATAVNDLLQVSITDNGTGIPDEIMQRIFLPNFTTKSNGSGIGLALSERIMALHGGQISAENKIDGGAVFTMMFKINNKE
jgi:nitrogen fixation/metabolism regulation signal transduction histidine kinase